MTLPSHSGSSPKTITSLPEHSADRDGRAEELNSRSHTTAMKQLCTTSLAADPSKWDMFIGFRGAPDYLVSMWRWTFSGHLHNGMTANFYTDDKLQSLLDAALDPNGGHTDANVDAFAEYLKSVAIVKGLFSPNSYAVGVSGITSIAGNSGPYIVPNASTYAANFGKK